VSSILSFILRPYRIEVGLGVVAVAFFFCLVLLEIICVGWESAALRSMTFTLFGIVGLIGLSIGIRRNELMKSQLNDVQFIERANGYIKDLGCEEFHVVKTALTSLERFHTMPEFPENEKKRMREALAFFIHSLPIDPNQINGVGPEVSKAIFQEKRQKNHKQEAAKHLYKVLGEDKTKLAEVFASLGLVKNGPSPQHFDGIIIGEEELSQICHVYVMKMTPPTNEPIES